MKMRLLFALVGWAISFALPINAQQKDTADPKMVQQRDLLGVVSALDEFGALSQKLDEAYNKNDGVNKEFHEGGKVRKLLGIEHPSIELSLGLTEKLNHFQSVKVGA
jgi:hypothetical protein